MMTKNKFFTFPARLTPPGSRSIRFYRVIERWCIKIAIAGSLAPVRLAWVPFLRVPKNGFNFGHINSKNSNRNLCQREQPTYDSTPNVSTNARGKRVAKPVFII